MNKLLLLSFTFGLFFFAILAYWKRDKLRYYYYQSSFEVNVYSNHDFKRNLNYRLYKPENGLFEKYPLIVYLHPWGEGGEDNKKHLSQLLFSWSKPSSQRLNPCYIFAPQCPADKEWVNRGPSKPPYKHYNQDDFPETIEMTMIIRTIYELKEKYLIDSNRIYVIGFSMGATACWDITTRYPDLFAAALIASGVSDTSKAYKLIDMPIWAFSGENDSIAPAKLNKHMIDKVNELGGNAIISSFKDQGHGIGYLSFEYPGVKEWLFRQERQPAKKQDN